MSQQHWENYYRSGALATAPMDVHGSFTLELAETWQSFFEDLPCSARVLDIGTGNGIVLAFAVNLAARLNRQWTLHGTDLAQIDPIRDVAQGDERFQNCQFYPGVANEALPFGDNAFDAVCGHYALEYSNVADALTELRRVLKPAGVSQFVIHHRDSVLVENAHKSLLTADFLLNKVKIYQKLRAFAEVPDDQAKVSSTYTRSLRAAIQAAKEMFATNEQQFDQHLLRVVIDAVGQLLVIRSRQGSGAALKEMASAETDLRSAVKRLKDLITVAMSKEQINELVVLAETCGLRCEDAAAQMHRGSVLVGWKVRLVAG